MINGSGVVGGLVFPLPLCSMSVCCCNVSVSTANTFIQVFYLDGVSNNGCWLKRVESEKIFIIID